ncbi:MAG TPA: sulfatase-like hydrolase/transferase [Candidatus Krumholzibacteria bacterium]
MFGSGRRARRGCAAFLALMLGVAGCERAAAPPDILLVTIDTLRADRLGCYGYVGAATPTLDRLAREGVRYAECQSPIPVTLPSHTSIMTGLFPPQHGVRNNTSYHLPQQIPTLAEELRNAGYATGAFVAAMPLARRFGLDRGFDTYDATVHEERSNLFSVRERPATEVVAAAVEWLGAREADAPVFLWAHFFEPHSPYEPPQALGRDAYDGEVAAADKALGALLGQFFRLRGAAPLTIVTSDHGEGLGEQGESTHAIFLYQGTLHVPLIFHAPGRWPKGRVVMEPVSLVDIAPTLLSELGIAPRRMEPAGIALNPGQEPPRRALYSESLYGMEAYRWAPLFASREGERKLIRSRRSWAFDLAADPKELQDLQARDELAWPAAGLHALDLTIESYASFQLDAGRVPSTAEIEALAALGYVGARPGSEPPPEIMVALSELPDATERHGEFAITQRAEGFIGRGEYAAAIDELRGVLADNPGNVWAHMLMGQALGSDGQNRAAIESYEQAVRLRPGWIVAHSSIARLHDRLGEPDAALVAYAEALNIDPGDVELRLEAARLLQRHGRLDEARELLDAGLGHAITEQQGAQIAAGLARVFFQNERFEEGRVHLDRARAVADDPSLRLLAAHYARRSGAWSDLLDILGNDAEWEASAEAYELRGEAQQRLGHVDEAVRDYEHALALADSLHLSQNNLAWALATSFDRAADALPHALRAIQLRPEELEYHDTYLEVLQRLGRDEEARERLRALLKEHPEDATLKQRAESLKVR